MDNIDQDIIQQYAGSLPEDQQMKFKLEYYGHRKNHWINLAVCIAAGYYGIHKFYIGQKNAGFVYLGMGLGSILFFIIGYFVLIASMFGSSLRMGMFEGGNYGNMMLGNLFAGSIFFILGALLALVLMILILIDICTFKKQTREANTEIAKTISSGL